MSNQLPTPNHTPVPPEHSLRNRVLAGAALAGTVGAGVAAVALGPDIIGNHEPANHTPAPLSQPAYETHHMARIEPGKTQKVHLQQHHKRLAAEHTQPAEQPTPNKPLANTHKKHQHHSKHTDSIDVVSKQADDQLPVLDIPLDIPTEELPPEPKELLQTHPENLTVSPEISQFMDENTLRIPALGCSGMYIRDPQTNLPVGINTAKHCSLRGANGHWGTDASGNSTLNFSIPLNVQAGPNFAAMENVGEISQVVLTPPDDETHDQVIAVFKDQDPEKVLAAADNEQMSEDEINNMQPGDIIFNAGYPLNQTKNAGPTKLQKFAMTVLGTAKWTTTDAGGKKAMDVNLLIAAVPEGEDGTECSWGDSGSEGFGFNEDGRLRKVGVLSAFNDFGKFLNKDSGQAAAERAYIENTFGVSMEGYSAVCGFAYEQPKLEEDAVVANVVTPVYEQGPIEKLRNWYAKEFFDPTFKRQVINGIVHVESGKDTFTYENPSVYYDAASESWILAGRDWYDGTLYVDVFDKARASAAISIFKRPEQTDLGIVDSLGPVTPNEDKMLGYTDSQNLVIGKTLSASPAGNPDGRLTLVDGQPTVEPAFDVVGDIEKAKAYLNDPATDKQSLEGDLAIGTIIDDDTLYVRNPEVVPNDDGSVVAFYTVAGEPIASFFPSPEAMQMFGNNDNTLNVHHFTGSLNFQADPTNATKGALVGSDNFPTAQLLAVKPQLAYRFVMSHDQKTGAWTSMFQGMK